MDIQLHSNNYNIMFNVYCMNHAGFQQTRQLDQLTSSSCGDQAS